ncbi:uncharacterized protein LOC122573229 [Bombus pyrosoma]|uniref:uncharacterized protein LOC122573229 n=1 Tax=Bombus pyrosoma TaxID=396416 RepID=UPI001CB99839|nr:uncharacterized protein LOC122573229 [Bombus pyrosoma]
MSLRRPRKRTTRKWLTIQGNKKRELHPSFGNHRLCDHFYATRSKSQRNTITVPDSNESLVISKQSSDSSIIYLGTFRNVPELINLEDSNDDYQEQVAKPDDIQSPSFVIQCNKIENSTD